MGAIGLLVALPQSRAQRAARIVRVGMLQISTEAGGAHLRAAFRQGMEDLGWLEEKNVDYRIVSADGDVGRLHALANKLIEQEVDVIVASSSATALAAQRATKTTPIVMVGVSNAVGLGLVASLAKPEGNITGISNQREEVLGKLIELLHAVTPGARRIAILLNENNPSYVGLWTAAQSACAALDLAPLRVIASTPAQLGAAVDQIVRQQSQAVIVVPDPVYLNERVKLQELMQPTRLPTAYGLREHVVAGGLLSYAADLAASYRQAAKYVDKILKGARAAELPVEQPTRYELVINLKTAKTLGLAIPQSLLVRADEVIQ